MNSELLPWQNVASFIRLHTHDVRNSLSSLDLEAAFLAEVMEGDDEAKQSLQRLRSQIHEIANGLKDLSAKMSDLRVTRVAFAARDLFLIWGDIPASMKDLPPVEWSESLTEEMIEVDPISTSKVFLELFKNAQKFGSGKLSGAVRVEDNMVVYEMRELKADAVNPQDWGSVPFASSKTSSYGLGLWQARRIAEANGGQFTQAYDSDSKTLISRLRIPIKS